MRLLCEEAIERYAHDHATEPSAVFAALREATYAEANSPQMQVGRVEGTLLRMLVTITGAERVLEVGTFTGYSALSMAEGLPEHGRLVTCDVDASVVAIAKRFWAQSPHGKKIDARLGDALETIAALGDETFDLAFVDADKARYVQYFEAILPRLRPGGLFVADNTLWSGRVLTPETPDDHGIHAFNELVARDPRVETVLLTVRDGVTLARKR